MIALTTHTPSHATEQRMSRTVIVERKSGRSGRRKTITRTFEHELQPSERARLEKSASNKQSKQSSLISETFKPQAFK